MDPRYYFSQALIKVGFILGVWMWQIFAFSAFSLFAILRTISPHAIAPIRNFFDPSVLAYPINGSRPIYTKYVKREV